MKDKISFKRDIILILALLLLTGVLFLLFFQFGENENSKVIIYVDGQIYQSYSLSQNGIYKIDTKYGENIIDIKDMKVSVQSSDCPKQVCVKHFSISKIGSTIVCLPHHFVITIENADESEDIIKS